jgi:hypothetical protein
MKQEGTQVEHYVRTNHIRLAPDAGVASDRDSDGIVGPSIRD